MIKCKILEVIRKEDFAYYGIRKKGDFDFLNIVERDFEFQSFLLGVMIRDFLLWIKRGKISCQDQKVLLKGTYAKSGKFKVGDNVILKGGNLDLELKNVKK